MDERELERLDIIAELEALRNKITDSGQKGEAQRRGVTRAINVVLDRQSSFGKPLS
jgi:hypothetical protein